MINDILERLKVQPSENLESETIEFKSYETEQALGNSKELADEVCALANTHGGQIIIGVVDSSNIKNQDWLTQLKGISQVDLDTTKERILGRIAPKIKLSVENISFESKNFVIVNIPKVTHSLVTTSSGKVYVREGKSSVPASPAQIQELVKNLQSYDWSGEENALDINLHLNKNAILEAKLDFCKRREIDPANLPTPVFLESIGATKNGVLNNSGLLFLGKKEAIANFLGLYEFRFSWKTQDGQLKINDVWDDCIWNSIRRAKTHFKNCNEQIVLKYDGKDYFFNTLDEQAFHEAFLNSVVHRDYTLDGMTSVNFKENELIITNPGTFYGGVTSNNISYHEPRHRNKALARLLMAFQMVDRAGMGVLRISLSSLMYGREFPVWKEKLKNIEVRMPAEYFKAEVFLMTQDYVKNCSITDLYIINSLFRVGFVNVATLEKDLMRITQSPWASIERSMNREEMKKYFMFHGNNDGIFICTTAMGIITLKVSKAFRTVSNSQKHVKLYKYLKRHKFATNEEVKTLLEFKFSTSTSGFLKKCNYLKNAGKSRNSKWSLK